MQSPSSLPGSWLAGDLSDDRTAVVHREMILYLKGISTGDFDEALVALLGKDTGGLSASTFGRLKDTWSEKHVRWSRRDLSAKQYVYFWADGIHVPGCQSASIDPRSASNFGSDAMLVHP